MQFLASYFPSSIYSLVEYFIDQAINLETQKMVLKGQHIDMAELGNNRVWQKSGSIIAGAVYGIAFASFLGIIFCVYTKIVTRQQQ